MNLHEKKFLVIEDDKHIFVLIKAMLKPYNITLDLATNGNDGLALALNNNYNLILLDIMLPQKDGWEICQQLHNSGLNTPIIILTAKAEETDKVLGLEIGADDYVTKPFSPRELIARIKTVLRRYENNLKPKEEILNFSTIKLKIDLKSYNVYLNEQLLTLTPKEFELLTFLAQNNKQVFKREQLLDQIWGYDNYAETRTIDEHIKRLRKKMTTAGLKDLPLQTVWGVGYKFEVERDENNEI